MDTLTEISGGTPQQAGADLVTNASAALTHGEANEPGSGDTLFASNHGVLLLRSGDAVSAGALASGSNFGIVANFSSQPSFAEADATLTFALRQGQGLTNASLTGTYSGVQFSTDVYANDEVIFVQRGVGASEVAGAMVFDGNGHLNLAATTGTAIFLDKRFPPQADDAEDPTVTLGFGGEGANQAQRLGLTYTLTATGELTVKDGATTIAVGAATPDLNIVVLRFIDETPDFPEARYLIGLKRGNGMNNASGQGHYRMINFGMSVEHSQNSGSPDVSPSQNQRSVSFNNDLGSFDLDGIGTVSVQPSVGTSMGMTETSGVQTHGMGPDDVLDANVSVNIGSGSENNGPETHTYTVSPHGIVVIDAAQDGGIEGYLSADGKVFVLPQTETNDPSHLNANILIALRQP